MTFLWSLGLAQLMMQTGMFVGAENFQAELAPALFTHFKREEDTNMKFGKLDEELTRMSEIVDLIVPGGMVLLNESFAATNEREGSEIARQIVTALLESEFACFSSSTSMSLQKPLKMNGAMFLSAERKEQTEV